MKKVFCLYLTLALLFVSCLGFPHEAKAATSGTTGTSQIYLTTKANWWVPGSESITIGASKGRYYYKKTRSLYATYQITVYNRTTGRREKYETMKNGSKKIKLKPNCDYQITVSYDPGSTWLRSDAHLGSWDTYPSWWVKSTHKVSSIY